MNEFEMIRKLTQASCDHASVKVGIGDDAAVVIPTAGMELVAACDTMVETVHFEPWSMRNEDIGFKALAANISDIAAMGAIPRWALISVSRPLAITDDALTNIYRGLYECAQQYNVQVVGGDMTRSPRHLVISVTIIGEVEAGRALLRSTARPGDVVFVTGEIGAAAAGLDYMDVLQKQSADTLDKIPFKYAGLVEAHRRPRPHVTAGRLLGTSGFRISLNDVSDGLANEVYEIAIASQCGIRLYRDALPMAKSTLQYAQEKKTAASEWALFGGEDYVLVGTMTEAAFSQLKTKFGEEELALFVIGEACAQFEGVRIREHDGTETKLEPHGYYHF